MNFEILVNSKDNSLEYFDFNVLMTEMCIKAGLFVDNIEQQDLTVKGYNKYNPRLIPTDRSSPRVAAIFEGITGQQDFFIIRTRYLN